MIDFLKLDTEDEGVIAYFKTHPLLEYMSNEDMFNRYDPEVLNTKDKYQYKGIIFCFYSNKRLKISFLPHYYFNGNLHNANDLNIIDCIKIILEFKNTFKIDWEKLKIINLEFGLNVVSPICIKDLITFLIYHEQHEFKDNPEYQFSKQSHSSNKKTGRANNNKIIKGYAKGLQFPEFCHINTFRFEIKSRESAYISKLEIFNLNDLLNVNVYYLLIDKLIAEFKNILILYDKIDFTNLNLKEVSKLNTLLSQSHWYRIKQDNKRNAFNDEKIKYYKLIDKTGIHLKKQLEKIICEKLELLKKGAISTLYNSRIRTQNKTQTTTVKTLLCQVTKINISMQKNDSILLSHTGLKHYYKNDKKVFEQIKRRYLSNRWLSSDFETQIKEIAHSIRNSKSNQSIKQNRIYKPTQLNILNTLGI
ncbi:hypothetical protein [Flavobacterium frigoris]|uniref:Uncharacterized protein n=1 Tax=Flavobacterium frigoris (strain PS1) TaxID=1086011 RepID=H7FPA4_FLAFP|nr:hypothetical protein [Flavobacterium frigoris]EIA09584.1 hypothetical protein HJ01_01002 [Flavobacterium frigoris PS1]